MPTEEEGGGGESTMGSWCGELTSSDDSFSRNDRGGTEECVDGDEADDEGVEEADGIDWRRGMMGVVSIGD